MRPCSNDNEGEIREPAGLSLFFLKQHYNSTQTFPRPRPRGKITSSAFTLLRAYTRLRECISSHGLARAGARCKYVSY
jgi:hypothetical protein